MSGRVLIPADPHERRRLWREWIHLDVPRVEREARQGVQATRRAAQASEARVNGDWLPEVVNAPAGVIHGLKRAVADCLVGGLLPLADRERLIRRAVKLGLTRFEANLLIAAVQHRSGSTAPAAAPLPQDGLGGPRGLVLRVARLPLPWLIGACVALEAIALILFSQKYL